MKRLNGKANTSEAVNNHVNNSLTKTKQDPRLFIRKVADDEAARIKELTGLDVKGYTHNLSDDDIRHKARLRENSGPSKSSSSWLPVNGYCGRGRYSFYLNII